MSSIALSGNASGAGVFTIASPNSASSYTATLPAATDTLATLTQANSYYGFKNRIINGAMVIDQRNAGASVTPAANVYTYTVDRFSAYCNQASKFTVQQSTTAPTGYINSLLATSSSAYSITSTDIFVLDQMVEGLNCADLAWGTASAATVTLSFWVRSSLTGTFGGSIQNSAQNRSYPFSYTISSANTFEQKTITIAGDTSGTWLTTNGIGLRVYFGLGCGSVQSGTAGAWAGSSYYSATGATSVVGTNAATFYITGVQLEKNSTATSFDYRPYGTELALCQRYYYRIVSQVGYGRFGPAFNQNTTASLATIQFPVTMRTSPTALEQSGTAANYAIIHLATVATCSAVPTFNSGTNSFMATVGTTVTAGLTAGNGSQFASDAGVTTAYLGWSAEL